MAFCHTQAVITDVLEGVSARRTLGGWVEITVGPRQQEYSRDDVSRLVSLWLTSYTPALDLTDFFEAEFGSIAGPRVARFFANNLRTIEEMLNL